MLDYHDSKAYSQTRQQQLRQEAENWHLRDQSAVDDENRTPFYAPLLARTGELLSEVGDQLQARYGNVEGTTSIDLKSAENC